jgi:alpha-glucoside transport system permease protein
MVIFIWVQTGFAMIILSAAVKAVPLDIVEASSLDGAGGRKMFRFITFPMVRSTVIVVFVTMLVTTLKLFDIVRTVTGGNFGTSVLSNEMFAEIFVRFDTGRGSAMAVILFIFILPIMGYNIYNLRRERANS